MISLRTHNVLDYVIGAVLLLCPFVFGFSDVGAAFTLFMVLGFGIIAYSLLTRYQYSLAKLIPVRSHMVLDVILGVALILGPSIFSYRALITDGVYALHWVLGLAAVTLVALTDRTATSMIRRTEEDETIRRVA